MTPTQTWFLSGLLSFAEIYIVIHPLSILMGDALRALDLAQPALAERWVHGSQIPEDGNWVIALSQFLCAMALAGFMIVWSAEQSLPVFLLTISWYAKRKFYQWQKLTAT